MRFHVPQFIEKESKIIGPLTLRQFLWLLAGGGLLLILKLFLTGTPLIIAVLIIVYIVYFIIKAFYFVQTNKQRINAAWPT